jgi:hypothetical protein
MVPAGEKGSINREEIKHRRKADAWSLGGCSSAVYRYSNQTDALHVSIAHTIDTQLLCGRCPPSESWTLVHSP